MTTHQTQAHDLIMKCYLSEKGISKAMAKRLALISIEDKLKDIYSISMSANVRNRYNELKLVKTEIENYNFKK